MSNKDDANTEKLIVDYLLGVGYPQASVRSMMSRHRHKGKRGARILKNNLTGVNQPKVLNIGCGSGMNHRCLIAELDSPEIYGLDVDREAIKICKAYNPTHSDKIEAYDGRSIPFEDQSFDAVICETVIEHVEDQKHFVEEIYRILRTGGLLYITTANKLWPIEPHYRLFGLSWLPKSIAAIYMRLAGKKGDYSDVDLPTYGRFVEQIRSPGFKVVDATFDVMRYPEKYEADKERPILKYLKGVGFLLDTAPKPLSSFLQWFNFGWILLGTKI